MNVKEGIIRLSVRKWFIEKSIIFFTSTTSNPSPEKGDTFNCTSVTEEGRESLKYLQCVSAKSVNGGIQ